MYLEAAEGLSPEAPQSDVHEDWRSWLSGRFPQYTTHDFAPEHEEFWEHVWSIEAGERPSPFVAIWARGWAKSTSAEMAVVALGLRKKKRYILYVCGTQDQADDHVQNIADMLEGIGVERMVTKYGASAGWRRNRLRIEGGFTVDAIGLDTAARGRKLEEARPDLIILDDLDDEADSEKVVDKKVRALTRKILPAGAEDLAVIAVQNLVHPSSIFSLLSDGRAKFLADRIVSGPIPAIEDLEYEERDGRFIITGGRATWAGMSLARCQEIVDDEGPDAFLVERQHLVEVLGQKPFRREFWRGKNRFSQEDGVRIRNRCYGRWIAADTAEVDDDAAAYTVLIAGELDQDYRLVIRDVWRGRPEFDELPDVIHAFAKKHNYDEKLKAVVIEKASSGVQALQVLAASSPPWLRDRLVGAQPVGAGHKMRLWKQAGNWSARSCILMPELGTEPWLFDFLEELYALPNARFKDQGDAFGHLVNRLKHYLSEGYLARNRAAA